MTRESRNKYKNALCIALTTLFMCDKVREKWRSNKIKQISSL